MGFEAMATTILSASAILLLAAVCAGSDVADVENDGGAAEFVEAYTPMWEGFGTMDANQDGQLTLKEVKDAFEPGNDHLMALTKAHWSSVFNGADTDKSGKITASEFKAKFGEDSDPMNALYQEYHQLHHKMAEAAKSKSKIVKPISEVKEKAEVNSQSEDEQL